MLRSIIVFVRYVAAIVVAYIVSFAVFFGGAALVYVIFKNCPEWMMRFAMGAQFALFAAVGFCGVISGTLCLEKKGRRLGSVVLSLLGLAFYAWFTLTTEGDEPGGNVWFPYVWLLPLAIGGSLGFLFFFRQQLTRD